MQTVRYSVFCVSTKSQHICSGVANEQKFFNLLSFSIHSAVSVKSHLSLRGFTVKSAWNWWRPSWHCTANCVAVNCGSGRSLWKCFRNSQVSAGLRIKYFEKVSRDTSESETHCFFSYFFFSDDFWPTIDVSSNCYFLTFPSKFINRWTSGQRRPVLWNPDCRTKIGSKFG